MTVNNQTETNSDTKSDSEANAVAQAAVVEVASPEAKVDISSSDFKAAVNAEVERVVQSRIARSQAATQKANDELALAVTNSNELKTNLDALQKKYDEVTSSMGTVSRENMLWKVAASENVSFDFVSSLRGETAEELTDAVKRVRDGVKVDEPSVDRIFSGKEYGNPSSLGSEILSNIYKKP